MSINQDIKTLGKDLTDEARTARRVTVEQTKSTVASVKTPLYAVIGASDHAAKVAREIVIDLRTKAETLPADLNERATAQAAAVRPDVLRDTVRTVVAEAVATAKEAVRRYEKRGQMVVADMRRAPGFTKVLKSAESAVDGVEDALEDLIKDAQGELKVVRKTTGSAATKAKATVRKASTRKPSVRKAPAKPNTAKATAARVTATKAAAKAPAKRTAAKNTAAKKTTARKARSSN